MKKAAILALIIALSLFMPTLAHASLVPESISAELAPEATASASAEEIDYSKDARVKTLQAFLEKYNSPMSEEAETFVKMADKYELPDWRLVPAIAGVESTFGKRIPANSYNAYGWGIFTGKSSGIAFSSWADGIEKVSKGLKEKYINRGATSVESIGRIYAASPTWSQKVNFFIGKMKDFEKLSESDVELTI